MSTHDILAELPRLSAEERERVAEALRDLAATGGTVSLQPVSQRRRAGLHAGAWQVEADFDAPLPEAFWLGNDA